VYRRGRKTRRPFFLLFGMPNDLGRSRLGLTVTRQTGSAVARNRIKRVLRDVFRRNKDRFPVSVDVVVNARRSILRLSSERLEREFLGAVRELARKVDR
jgi:ribonuclease P protein component